MGGGTGVIISGGPYLHGGHIELDSIGQTCCVGLIGADKQFGFFRVLAGSEENHSGFLA